MQVLQTRMDMPRRATRSTSRCRGGWLGRAARDRSTLRTYLEDAPPVLEGRPALEHARRVAPGYPGHTQSVFPQAWLQA